MSDGVCVLREASRLGEGEAVRFRVPVHGVVRDAFALRWRGRVVAYVNACRHQSRTLDLGDGRFLDGGELVCVHHGARYAPGTGACLDGPCSGGALTPLAVTERDGALWCDGPA